MTRTVLIKMWGWAPVFRAFVVLGLVVLLAGCVGDEARDDDPGMWETDQAIENNTAPRTLDAPVLAEGDSCSYVAEGRWVTVDELTIVVARSGSAGTLFAASNGEELDDEVAWDLPILGETDERLRAISEGGEMHPARLLDFPLEPEKSWDHWDVELVARPANVTALGDMDEGYRVEGESESRRVVVEYSPRFGCITFFEEFSKDADQALWRFTLTRAGTGADWVWYERGDEVIAQALVDPSMGPVPGHPPESLEVGEEDDRVFFWALGSPGGRGVVSPPPGGEAPWLFETQGVPEVQKASFDAVEGTWSLSGSPGDPEGWLYIQAHALRFLGPAWDSG